MSAISSTRPSVAIGEYLEQEHLADARHEYLDGMILAMAGGTHRHSKVCLNVGSELRFALKGRPGDASEANTRVAIARRRSFVYPDVTVVCGVPQFDPLDKRQTTIVNPTLVVEVLSEGTENYDRGDKFSRYREIQSLQEYVIVETSSPRVETFVRHSDGTWEFSVTEDLARSVTLKSLGVQIRMAEIYEKIQFPPPSLISEPSNSPASPATSSDSC